MDQGFIAKRSAVNRLDRVANIDGLVNARDLGGLRRSNGEPTPYGVFYRAENIDMITPLGWDQLKEYGIRTVIDLRQHNERDNDLQKRPSWLTVLHSDLDGVDNQQFWQPYLAKGLENTSLYYLDHLSQMPERAAEILRMCAEAAEGGVLFHCKSGRDRTGLIALLLLLLAKVEPEEVVDDYLETIRLGEERGKRLERENPELALDALMQKYHTSSEASFRNVIEHFELSDFLENTRLSDAVIQSLKSWRGSMTML